MRHDISTSIGNRYVHGLPDFNRFLFRCCNYSPSIVERNHYSFSFGIVLRAFTPSNDRPLLPPEFLLLILFLAETRMSPLLLSGLNSLPASEPQIGNIRSVAGKSALPDRGSAAPKFAPDYSREKTTKVPPRLV
jgi:hypothetical protein